MQGNITRCSISETFLRHIRYIHLKIIKGVFILKLEWLLQKFVYFIKPSYYLGLTLNQTERNYLRRQLGHSAAVHDKYFVKVRKQNL